MLVLSRKRDERIVIGDNIIITIVEIRGDKAITEQLDILLNACVAQGRMRLPGKPYSPCYRLTT